MSYYVHAVPGRMRIKIPNMKGNGSLADAIEAFLATMAGVSSACANTLTGSVVINHDPAEVDTRAILAALSERGYIDEARTISIDDYFQAKAAKAGRFLAKTLYGAFMEQALAGSPVALLTLLL